MGTIISISSRNWLYVWVGLEVNLLSFIPLLMCGINETEVERALKYFLVQALGSCLILLGSFNIIIFPNSLITYYACSLFLFLSIIIKIGIFPFHYWVPQVIGGIRWLICLILSIWQKIRPLVIMGGLIRKVYRVPLILTISLGALVGGFGGINQRQIRVLLAYSSIGHIRWIGLGLSRSMVILMIYFVIYSLTRFIIMAFIIYSQSKMVNLNNYGSLPLYIIMFLAFLFFRLGGIPPFIGFYRKLIIISELIWTRSYLCIRLLVGGSLINIFYYLNIFLNLLLKSVYTGFNNVVLKIDYLIRLFLSVFLIVNILGIVIIMYALIIFYKSQRHWNTIYNFWNLVWIIRDINKNINSSGVRAARCSPRKRSTI